MRKGIYSFRITSYGRVAKGIAKVKGDVMRGLISNRVYVTERSAKTVWRLKAYRDGYASETQGVSMRGNEAILDGDESEALVVVDPREVAGHLLRQLLEG